MNILKRLFAKKQPHACVFGEFPFREEDMVYYTIKFYPCTVKGCNICTSKQWLTDKGVKFYRDKPHLMWEKYENEDLIYKQ